jgi:hypothetical protein
MTATTNTDVFIALVYIVAALKRPFAAAWNATKPERTTQ